MMFRRFLTVFVMTLTLALPASAQSVSGQKDKKARLENEIRILENQLKANSRKSDDAVARHELLQGKISARKELLKVSEAEFRILTDSVRVKSRQSVAAQARLDTMTVYYERLIRNAYKNRDPRVWLMYIMSSGSVSQAVRRYSYLKNLSNQMKIQGERIIQERDLLSARLADLKRMQLKARKVRDERQDALSALQKEETQSRALVAQLKRNSGKYQSQLASKRKQVEELNRQIQKMIAAEVGSSSKNSSKSSAPAKPVDTRLSSQFASNKGRLPWPAEGRVTGRFGRHNHPVYTKLVMPFNNGINMAVAPDAPVCAVFDGVVKQVIVMPGYKQCILVQHGEYFTFYCKLGTVKVKTGDKVVTGQCIGHVVTIGNETQLHFQVWKGSVAQDPELWLR